MLEEMENHVDEIRCDDSSVSLFFNEIETLELAYAELSRVAEFALITSHEGCNTDGERGIYKLAFAYVILARDKCADRFRVSELEI